MGSAFFKAPELLCEKLKSSFCFVFCFFVFVFVFVVVVVVLPSFVVFSHFISNAQRNNRINNVTGVLIKWQARHWFICWIIHENLCHFHHQWRGAYSHNYSYKIYFLKSKMTSCLIRNITIIFRIGKQGNKQTRVVIEAQWLTYWIVIS